MIDHRDLLIYLSLTAKGDWSETYSMIKNAKIINASPEDVKKTLSEIKSNILTIFDPEYPEYLKKIYRPPFVLFYYGDISLLNTECVGVIGSRKCSDYGLNVTDKIVGEICPYLTIVSGLARGIDSCAHTSALKNKGKTIAILGSGIDYCYPSENIELYDEIKKNHLVLSEFPNDTPPDCNNFPFRNRLISAFSKGLLVTESKKRSGTSITVGFALSEGKDVMCVPYPIDEDSNCNQLIKDGATLVENGSDVLFQLGIKI